MNKHKMTQAETHNIWQRSRHDFLFFYGGCAGRGPAAVRPGREETSTLIMCVYTYIYIYIYICIEREIYRERYRERENI